MPDNGLGDITITEAAWRARCHPDTIRRACSDGRLPYVRRFDGRIRVNVSDLEAFIRSGKPRVRATR